MTETNEFFESEFTAREPSDFVVQPGDPAAYGVRQTLETMANRGALELLSNIAGKNDWMSKAVCKGLPQDGLFYPPPGLEIKDDRLLREAEAKSICAACGVASQCLEYALNRRDPEGVWGGTSEDDRRIMLKLSVRRSNR